MSTMRQKKKKSILIFFLHLQNKTTENLNLRIKEDEFEDMHKDLDDISQHFGPDDEKHIWCPIEKKLDNRLLIQV